MADVIEKYRPSNGCEGDLFMNQWCRRCTKDNFCFETGEGGCEIVTRTLVFAVDDPDYPEQWQYRDGDPVCTAFEPVPKQLGAADEQ